MLRLVTKTVNYIRGRSLNHRQFRQLLEDTDNQFTDVPFYAEVQKMFHLVRQEINTFFGDERSKHRRNESWLQDLDFVVDIAAQLNDLNLKLQGKHKLITQLYDDVKCFVTNLSLWKSIVSNENFVHFPT